MPEHTEPLEAMPTQATLRARHTAVGQVPLSRHGSRSSAEMVAAIDAVHRSIEMSDEQCDGVADDVQINDAVGRLPV